MRQLRRYGSTNVPITAVGAIIYGVVLLTSPATSFTAVAYRQGPFLIADQRIWGLTFAAAGVVALSVRRTEAVIPLILVVAGWAVALMFAAFTQQTVSPTAGFSWALIAAQLATSVLSTRPAAP